MPHAEDALTLLRPFEERGLPALLRRLYLWRSFDAARHVDVVEDMRQELRLDCVEHAEEIVAAETRERHRRWFRIVERSFYRLCVRGARRHSPEIEVDLLPTSADRSDAEVAPPTTTSHDLEVAEDRTDPVSFWGHTLPHPKRQFLRKLAASASYLKNGRINCRASADSIGLPAREVRDYWNEVACELGFDDEFLQFWRRRLVEALLGLAADLLRDRNAVLIHDESARRPPDPFGRLRRIRTLHRRIGQRRIPADVRQVMSRYRGRCSLDDLVPRAVLAEARDLHPFDPAVHLWMFEACLAERDFPAAIDSLRAARRNRADPVRVLLARTRLLVDRDRCHAATRLLSRCSPATRRDPRLRTAIAALAG